MKLLLATVLFAAVVVVSVKPSSLRKCRSSDDCPSDECCIMKGFYRLGDCTERGKENDSCSVPEAEFEGKFMEHCPCLENLICDAEWEELPNGLFRITKEHCVAGDSTTSEEESTE